MKRQTKRAKRHALYGWVKWFPVLALIFTILFIDAWLNIQKRKCDYILGSLNADLRTLNAESDKIGAQAALNRNLDDLAKVQEELGMIAPVSGQIETIEYIPGTWQAMQDSHTFTLAHAPNIGMALPLNDLNDASHYTPTEPVAEELQVVAEIPVLAPVQVSPETVVELIEVVHIEPEPDLADSHVEVAAEITIAAPPVLKAIEPEEVILDGLTIVKRSNVETVAITMEQIPQTPIVLEADNLDASIDQLLD